MKSLESHNPDGVIYTPRRPRGVGHLPTRLAINRAERARNIRLRDEIFAMLDGKCAVCGVIDHLQIDIIDGVTDGHHEMSYGDRLRWYLKQAGRDNAQLLCQTCHNRKTAQDMAKRSIGRLSCPRCGCVIDLGSPGAEIPKSPLT